MVLELHQVDLNIPRGGENRACEIYCGILGMTEIPEPEVSQKLGGIMIRLESEEPFGQKLELLQLT